MSNKDPKVNLCYAHIPKGRERKANMQLVEDKTRCQDPAHGR